MHTHACTQTHTHTHKSLKEEFEHKRFHWELVKEVERPRVVNARVAPFQTKEILFAQVIVYLHTQQVCCLLIKRQELMARLNRYCYLHSSDCSYLFLVPVTIAMGITTHIIEGTGGDRGVIGMLMNQQ